MVKGNIILEGNGPSKERVPNGLLQSPNVHVLSPAMWHKQTETCPQSLVLQNDSTNGCQENWRSICIPGKIENFICSKLSHGGKIAGNSLSQPPALFIFPSCFQLLLHSKEKILAIDLGTSDIDSTTGHFPDLLNSTPALASCQLFGSSKNQWLLLTIDKLSFQVSQVAVDAKLVNSSKQAKLVHPRPSNLKTSSESNSNAQ